MQKRELDNLDNDFITIWSRWLLSAENYDVIKGDLRQLAMCNQINAVQYWYWFNSQGVCPEIDEIVRNFNLATFDEMFAYSNFKWSDSKEHLTLTKLFEQLQHNRRASTLSYLARDFDDMEKYHNNLTFYREQILGMPMNKYCRMAGDIALNVAVDDNDLVLMQEALEMLEIYRKRVALESVDKKLKDKLQDLNNVVIKGLIKTYKQLIKRGNKATILENPELCFALAKAILMYPTQRKFTYFKHAIDILRVLANRELSVLTNSECTSEL